MLWVLLGHWSNASVTTRDVIEAWRLRIIRVGQVRGSLFLILSPTCGSSSQCDPIAEDSFEFAQGSVLPGQDRSQRLIEQLRDLLVAQLSDVP